MKLNFQKECTKCGLIFFSIDDFTKDKSKKDGLRSSCKKCHAAYTLKRYYEDGRRESKSIEGKFKRKNNKEWWENEKKKKREWYRNNPERSREMGLKSRFGIDAFTFNTLYRNQNGKCAICNNSILFEKSRKNNRASSHIDHNHETGEIRGLLCGNCNIGIGNFKDNEELLLNAILYLKNYPQKNKSPIYAKGKSNKEKRA